MADREQERVLRQIYPAYRDIRRGAHREQTTAGDRDGHRQRRLVLELDDCRPATVRRAPHALDGVAVGDPDPGLEDGSAVEAALTHRAGGRRVVPAVIRSHVPFDGPRARCAAAEGRGDGAPR